MAKIRHKLVEVGSRLQVLNKHQVKPKELVTFSFKLKDGQRTHRLAVHGEKTNVGPAFLTLVPPSTSWEVTVSPDDPERQQIHARMKEDLPAGDYVYEIEEHINGAWKTVLDPILEIEGGNLQSFPNAVVAVGVGLLAGFLAYKALK
jgi:hypothetical protein